ncbi:MAG TPA: ActS/PrrB/RegB family redox-sensitive histidine kinase [Rhizomicrobium sp.]|jgi:two-component system sensor histidine kinase RegB
MSETILPHEAIEDLGRPSLWGAVRAPIARGRVRLRTLSNLRWLAVAGQAMALFIVYFGLGYKLPIVLCAGTIATSVALNVGLAIRYAPAHRLLNWEATIYLGFDILQLAVLLYLTGGILNPFALMFLAPVVIAAATLNLGNTLILAALAFVSVSVIAIFHRPLPWEPGPAFTLPELYVAGIWSSLVIGIGFTSVYAWRIASEAARMSAGLAATQLALSREHRLSSIGALATAAAHELGTPLGTIAVVSRELERALPEGSAEREDATLLREQAERCRAILTKLARPEDAVLRATECIPIGALLDDIAGQYRGEDVAIVVEIASQNRSEPQPKVWRAPELLHGFANIIENASDFAKTKVTIRASWSTSYLEISVQDDGPGFAPEIFERIGEPYITSRPGHYALGGTELAPGGLDRHEGMGLGFFIAKTLLEQLGGTMTARNLERGGAYITARWARGAIDGENPPHTAMAEQN